MSTLPLAKLFRQMSSAEFAPVLVDRWRNGNREEVAAFLRSCDRASLEWLVDLRGEEAPWWQDFELWLALLRLTGPRALYLRCAAEIIPVSQAFSREMQAIAHAVPASHDRDALVKKNDFILRSLFDFFWYEGIAREEVLALIDWALELRREADFAWAPQGLKPLIAELKETSDLLSLAEAGGAVCKQALEAYERRSASQPADRRWQPWHDFFTRHPELYDLHPIDDPELIAMRWQGADAECRRELFCRLLKTMHLASSPQWKHCQHLFDRLVRESPAVLVAVLENSYDKRLIKPHMAEKIWDEQYPELLPMLLPLVADSDNPKAHSKLVHKIFATRPDDLLRVAPVKFVNLLPLLDANSFKALLPQISKLVASSSAKALREGLAKFAKKMDLGLFVEAGWLKQKAKNLQLAYRDILLAHPDPAALGLLAELLRAGGLDAASASTLEAYLHKRGVGAPVSAATQVVAEQVSSNRSLASLEAQAAKVKRFAAAIKPFDTAEILTQLQPLSEHAARVVFHLAATAEGALPPLAEQLLAQVPVEGRARLALAVVETWVEHDGEPKLRWALQLCAGNTDDRVVDTLAAAARAWAWPKKLRAVAAVEQLGALDSLYALARVQEIASLKKVRDMVVEVANQTLKTAAARRKLSVVELCDELTPDFGLGQGLTLAVGERIYRVLLQGDLSLRVLDEQGKASKSLPANKDAATQSAWEAASSHLKTLAAGLKAVLKQQGPRMEAAFVTGKTWPLERWQRLFLDHPLLRSVGRSLIWQVQGAGSSFRIAEDFSLLDVEDNGLRLPADARIGLWHPASAEAGEAEAWKIHLADYELEPLVDQVGAPSALPPAERCNADLLLAPDGLVLEQGKLAPVLSKSGYRPGSVQDGPGIYDHEWSLPAAQLLIRLKHSRYMPYMDLSNPVTIDGFVVFNTSGRGKPIKPADLPKPLLATLMGHLQLMASKAKVAQPA